MRRQRHFWEDEQHGGVSADWVVIGLCLVIVLAGLLGFWFLDMYQKQYGIFPI